MFKFKYRNKFILHNMFLLNLIIIIIISLFIYLIIIKLKCKNNPNSNNNNPFLLEDKFILKELENDINNILINKKGYDWSILRWLHLIIKYKDKVTDNYYKFKLYDIFYEEETYIFEKEILEYIKPYKNILDFGCGTCKIWRNNCDIIKNYNIKCVDLDKNTLSYPKYLLRNYNNILIEVNDVFNIELNYDIIFLIEVIMQIDNPVLFIQKILIKNPKIKFIMAHTIFTPNISKIIDPFKNKCLKYVPILNVSSGKALTYNDTINIIEESGCKIIDIKKIFANKIIFIFEKII